MRALGSSSTSMHANQCSCWALALSLVLVVQQATAGPKCYKRGQEKPIQTCDVTVCNNACRSFTCVSDLDVGLVVV